MPDPNLPDNIKVIVKRAEVLRNALDHGILNLQELHSFLVTVERISPRTKKRTPREERIQRYMELLSQGTRSKRKPGSK